MPFASRRQICGTAASSNHALGDTIANKAQHVTYTCAHTEEVMPQASVAHGHRKHGNNNDITLHLGFRQGQASENEKSFSWKFLPKLVFSPNEKKKIHKNIFKKTTQF